MNVIYKACFDEFLPLMIFDVCVCVYFDNDYSGSHEALGEASLPRRPSAQYSSSSTLSQPYCQLTENSNLHTIVYNRTQEHSVLAAISLQWSGRSSKGIHEGHSVLC